MNDLEELISGLLTERAEPVRLPADTAALARARAQRTRRRHQWTAVATSALVVLALAAGTAVVVDGRPSSVAVTPGAASSTASRAVASGPSATVGSGAPTAADAPCTAAVVVDGHAVWGELVSHTIHLSVGSSVGLDLGNDASSSGSPCGIVSSPRLGHDGVLADLTSPRPTAEWLAVGAGTADVSVTWTDCRTCLEPLLPLATYHLVVDPSPSEAPWPPCHVTFQVTEPGRTPRTLVLSSRTEVSAGARITVGIQGAGQCQIEDLAQTSAPGDSPAALKEQGGAWVATNEGPTVIQDQLAVVVVCAHNLDPLSEGGPCPSEPIVRSLTVVVRPRSSSGG